MAPAFLGPPELRKPSPKPGGGPTSSDDAFMNLIMSDFNTTRVGPRDPNMAFTENMAATYVTAGDPCLDFFFHVVPNTNPNSIQSRLAAAWEHDPLTTLKLIFNLRGVRGTGKSDKEGFYTAACWLHGLHPKTLACNVPSFADFGYFKDLPEILYRILEGCEIRKKQKAERFKNSRRVVARRGAGTRLRGRGRLFNIQRSGLPTPFERKKNKKSKRTRLTETREIRIQNSLIKDKTEEEKASIARKEKKVAMAKKAVESYSRDPDYRFLYERVTDFFADCLKADMEHMKSGQFHKIGLAAKWCPSIDSTYDRATLLCESIARKIFPREAYPEYEGVEEEHYAYRVRDRLRKEVLVPIRKILELPEVYIGANKWESIPYNRVASVAMKFYKEKFLEHDGERFSKYLEDVKSGKAKIAAGALLPHEIIQALNDDDGGQVAELQWKRMVDDLLQKGKLSNCLAICDVSASMAGTPMEVCVALGILVSELSEDPWKGKVITFSENPKLEEVKGNSLLEKTQMVKRMEWGGNTDFQKVFDLILKVAVNGNLKEDRMIKRVFVFSDMEFDKAGSNPWETDYQAIVRKFTAKGYGNVIPEMVFWNLRDSRATPVPGTQKGVALVSGFSKNLLKLFLEGDGCIDPMVTMQAAISGEEYQKLAVLD